MAALSKPEIKTIAEAVDRVIEIYTEVNNTTDKSNSRTAAPQRSLPEEPSRKAQMEVHKIIANPSLTPEKAHAEWVKNRESLGWKYRTTLDRDKKLHPLLVPYEKLPKKYRIRDALYFSLVREMAHVTRFSKTETKKHTPAEAPAKPYAPRVGQSVGDGGFIKDDLSNVTRPIRNF